MLIDRSNNAIHDSINVPVLANIPPSVRRVLDLGCGTGALGRELKRRQSVEVIGITKSADEAAVAEKNLDRVLVQDLETFELDQLDRFDCVVCSHVLGYLDHPRNLLRSVRAVLAPAGILVVAIPNVLFWRQRWHFLRGKFRYTVGGVMDSTYRRFFDWESAQMLLPSAGYSVVSAEVDGGFPGSRRLAFRRLLDRLALKVSPGLFAWQFVIVGKPNETQA